MCQNDKHLQFARRSACRQWRNLTNTQLAVRIQASWVEGDQWAGDGAPLPQYYPSAAEVRCAAALAATGHLTSVECMKLRDLQLPSRRTITSLAVIVRSRVELNNVTGDLAPLVTSLHNTGLQIDNMELDQAATSSLARALQHGVTWLTLGYNGPVRLHVPTLADYDGRGRCGGLTMYWDDSAAGESGGDTYQHPMKVWALSVDWSVEAQFHWIVMKRK